MGTLAMPHDGQPHPAHVRMLHQRRQARPEQKTTQEGGENGLATSAHVHKDGLLDILDFLHSLRHPARVKSTLEP